MNEQLKLRMYCMVLYNLSPIQQGIQSLHATVRYGREYSKSEKYAQWADIDQTVIIYSAGSSVGLTDAKQQLLDNGIEISEFAEPDLYNQVTAICFLADEKVWDREKYYDLELHDPYIVAGINKRPDIQEKIKQEYINAIGGEKQFFLKNFLKKYRFA